MTIHFIQHVLFLLLFLQYWRLGGVLKRFHSSSQIYAKIKIRYSEYHAPFVFLSISTATINSEITFNVYKACNKQQNINDALSC